MAHDAGEVVGKLTTNLHGELRMVVEEMVQQSSEFWTNQLHKADELHKDEVRALQAECSELREQLEKTVRMYNDVRALCAGLGWCAVCRGAG